MARSPLRSTGAVVAGFVLTVVLALTADAILRSTAPAAFSSDGFVSDRRVLLLVLVYTAVFATIGGWLAARLAPERPMRHALILGWISLVLSIAGTAAAWQHAPVWYHAIAVLLVVPAAWFGGSIAARARSQN